MRKILLGLTLALFACPASANWTGKDATPATITFYNPGVCTSVVCTPVVQLTDGTNQVTLTTAGADAVSNTLTGLPVYSRPSVFNGTTWDRWTGAVAATLAAETTKVIGTVRVASGGIASGSIASGAVASGAVAAGALAAGAGVDGWDLTQGAIADAAATQGGTGSVSAKLRLVTSQLNTISTNTGAAIPAGTNTIGGVFPVAQATGGSTTTGNIAANNTTAVVIKASAGTLYGVQLYGIGSAPAYLKIYNATSATCGSGTPVKRLMIPAASTAANGAGSNITFSPGVNFGTGITYCVTTGITDADTTAPAASTFLVNIDYQ